MRLVDDVMEPFRPVIDLRVWHLRRNGDSEVTPETKRALVRTLYDDMQTDAGATPVMVCAQKLAVSLAQVYLGEREKLDLPLPGLPLALANALQMNSSSRTCCLGIGLCGWCDITDCHREAETAKAHRG